MNTDKEVGAAIAKARIGAGMSQSALAKQMREHGWWQQTVARVEEGSRKLRYLEARTLRQIIPFDSEVEVPVIDWYEQALERVKALIEEELGREG